MKAIKLMLSGIMVAVVSSICLVTNAAILWMVLMLLAIALFIWGLMTK